jgi:hypothetical protein
MDGLDMLRACSASANLALLEKIRMVVKVELGLEAGGSVVHRHQRHAPDGEERKNEW